MSSYNADYTHDKIIEDIMLLDKFSKNNQKNGFKNLSGNILYGILHEIAWAWTENRDVGNGKTKSAKTRGCELWTKEAFDVVIEKQGAKYSKRQGKKWDSGVTHEHILPKIRFKESLSDYILSKNCINKTALTSKMNEILKGCVVTTEQAKELDKYFQKKLPSKKTDFFQISEKECWDRYRETNKYFPQTFSEIYLIEWKYNGKKQNYWEIINVKSYITI